MPKLTKAYIDKLAPDPDKNRLIWDNQVPGFGIRVNRGGSRFQPSWECRSSSRAMAPARKRAESVGSVPRFDRCGKAIFQPSHKERALRKFLSRRALLWSG